MEPFVRGFVRTSLVWLGGGVLLGLIFAFSPGQVGVHHPGHMYANLVGFVSLMVFGIAYHAIPRLANRPLRSPLLAAVHLWVSNIGLSCLVLGWLLRAPAVELALPFLRTGTLLSAAGAVSFIYNLWMTLGPEPGRARRTMVDPLRRRAPVARTRPLGPLRVVDAAARARTAER